MTPAEVRAALKRLGMGQTDFARYLAAHGDDRPLSSILRTVSELCRHERRERTPWAVAVLLRLLEERAGEETRAA